LLSMPPVAPAINPCRAPAFASDPKSKVARVVGLIDAQRAGTELQP